MSLQIVDFLVERLPSSREAGLNLTKSFLAEHTIEPALLGAVALFLKLFSFFPKFTPSAIRRFTEDSSLTAEAVEHRLDPVIRERNPSQRLLDLSRDLFLTYRRTVLVLARRFPLGAVKIHVALARLRRDKAAALTAADQSAVQVRFEAAAFRTRAIRHDRLADIEQPLGDQRLMNPIEQFTLEAKGPVVDGVLKQTLHDGGRKHGPALPSDTRLTQQRGDPAEGIAAGGEMLEGAGDVRSGVGIRDKPVAFRIMLVSDRSRPGPHTLGGLAAFTALDVF